MPRVIVKCRYYTPQKSCRDLGGMLRYIATREGVDKFGDEWKNESVTQTQMDLIMRFTESIPQCKHLPAFQTYQQTKTKGTASEFISAVLEDHPELLAEKTYLDYIATRPRTEQIAGKHGLFTDKNVSIDLQEEAERVRNHNGNVFTIIVSLKREDAERLEFNSAERWCNITRCKMPLIAKEYGIPLDSLKWFGAYHNEAHHPHIHLMLYSTDENNPGYIKRAGLERIRHMFATELFKDDLKQIYDDQTAIRNKLNATAFDEIEELAEKVRTGLATNADFVAKFIALAERLQTIKGKKVYGYLSQAVRKQVCSLVDLLEEDEDIAQMYELWYQAKCAVYNTYTDNNPPKKPLSEEEAFKPIRNAMIKEADALGAHLHRVDSDTDSEEKTPVQSIGLAHQPPHSNAPPVTTSKKARNSSNIVASSVLRFGHSLSRTFRNSFYEQVDKSPMSVDSKLQREIEAKKRGQNLAM